MATGIPKTKHNDHNPGNNVKSKVSRSSDVLLCYQGKRSEEEVLATPPADFQMLWPHNPTSEKDLNTLYYGDNLHTLASLLANKQFAGQVKLVYIDPPFATKSVFQSRSQVDAYDDLLEGSHYIEFIRERLIILRELLTEDGSIYVHLDQNMAFQIKCIMDEVFGRENFRNLITRKKCNPKNYTRKVYGNISDHILFYTKSDNYVWNRPVEEWTDERSKKEYEYIEPSTGRRYKKVPVHAPGVRNGETGQPWRGKLPPPGKHWQYPPRVLDEMDARGEIYWSPNGNPRRKIYFDNSRGVAVQDIWLEFRDAHNQNIQITGYPTEKNPDLLARIIQASSNPGDLVLDCFVGSGTTLTAASALGRHWVGIDNSVEAIRTTLKRFVKGLERMGDFVTKKPAPDQARLARGLPLFEVQKYEEEPVGNEVIDNFVLYAERQHAQELEGMLADWVEWLREKHIQV